MLRHIVAGGDSGDMLKGENARVLAADIAEQLKQAFEPRMNPLADGTLIVLAAAGVAQRGRADRASATSPQTGN